ncbi:hypothetical protein [Gallaecimonas sp. GXIMD4217]|uniref:hypothetical protein n=1 Tax=Gallaecimonas sp. GXIMD4217 TaxID=3131927 RepID=UPI00311AFAFD
MINKAVKWLSGIFTKTSKRVDKVDSKLDDIKERLIRMEERVGNKSMEDRLSRCEEKIANRFSERFQREFSLIKDNFRVVSEQQQKNNEELMKAHRESFDNLIKTQTESLVRQTESLERQMKMYHDSLQNNFNQMVATISLVLKSGSVSAEEAGEILSSIKPNKPDSP